jgi:hypothetical protein
MVAVLKLENFGDTFIVVAAISTAFMAGAAFGFQRAIKAVADYEDEKTERRFVRWFVGSGTTSHKQAWRSWGIGGVALGVWLGGGMLLVVVPVSLVIWAIWVH